MIKLFAVSILFLVVNGHKVIETPSDEKVQGDIQHPTGFQYKDSGGPPDPGSFSEPSSDPSRAYKDFAGPSEPSSGPKGPEPPIHQLSKPSSDSPDSLSSSARHGFAGASELSSRPKDPESHSKPSSDSSNSFDSPSLSIESNDPPFRPPQDSLDSPIIHYKLSRRFQNRRNTRSVDPNAKQFKDRIGTLARLTNAVALQTGILNGKIPIEEVVGELLNFGSAKVSEVIAFNETNVNELVDKIQSTDFYGDGDLGKLILISRGMQKMLPTLDKLPDRNGYFAKVNDFHVNFEAVKASSSSLVIIREKLDVIKSMNLNDGKSDDKKKEDVRAFKDLVNFMNQFKTSYSELPKFKEGLSDLEKLISDRSVLHSLDLVVKLVARRSSTKTGPFPYDIDSLNQQCSRVVDDGLLDITKKAQKDVGLLKTIVSSHSFSKSFPHKYDAVWSIAPLFVELNDDWFAKIIPNSVVTVNQLVKGLKPLKTLSTKMLDLKNQLNKIIMNDDVIDAFSRFDIIERNIEKLTPRLKKSFDFHKKAIDCFEKGDLISGSPFFWSPISDLLGQTKDVKRKFQLLKLWNFSGPEKQIGIEFEKFHKALGNSDFESATWNTIAELQPKLIASDSFEPFVKFMGEVEKVYGGNSNIAKEIKRDALAISGGEKVIQDFFAHEGYVNETEKVWKCLQTTAEDETDAEQLRLMITAGKQKRYFNGGDAEHVKSVATAIGQFSKSLGNQVKSFLEEMNKEVNENTKKMSSMTDLWQSSVTMGESAWSLQTAHDLVGLEDSLPELYEVDTFIENNYIVTVEVNDYLDFYEQFDNSLEDISTVGLLINETKRLNSKIDLSKMNSIAAYSAPFQEMTAVPVIPHEVNFRDKLRVFQSIAYSFRTNTHQRNLIKFANLDLQFANHQKQFLAMPKALEGLNDFLVGFLTVDTIAAGGSEDASAQQANLILIIVCSIFGGILVIAGIVVLVMWLLKKGCFKPKPVDEVLFTDGRDPVSKELIHFYMCSYRFSKPLDAYNLHASILRTIKADEAKPTFLTYADIDKKKCRDPEIKLLNKFAIKSIEYHGNRIMTRTGLTFFALQGPLSKSKQHADTRGDFLELIVKEDLLQVVMLCRFQEPGPDGKSREVCARYFNEMKNGPLTIGDWKVTTVVEEVLEDLKDTKREADITHRRLEIYHKKKKYPLHIVEHYQYNTWDDNSYPPHGHAGCFLIMEKVRNTERGAVAVHCSTGTGRTMAFIGMEYIARLVEVDTNVTFVQAATKLATYRHKAIQSIRQSYWMQVGVVFYLGQYHGLVQTYELHLHEFKELAVKTDKHPEIPKVHDGVLF